MLATLCNKRYFSNLLVRFHRDGRCAKWWWYILYDDWSSAATDEVHLEFAASLIALATQHRAAELLSSEWDTGGFRSFFWWSRDIPEKYAIWDFLDLPPPTTVLLSWVDWCVDPIVDTWYSVTKNGVTVYLYHGELRRITVSQAFLLQ